MADAGGNQFVCMPRQSGAVGGQGQFVQLVLLHQGSKDVDKAHDVLSHQRFPARPCSNGCYSGQSAYL